MLGDLKLNNDGTVSVTGNLGVNVATPSAALHVKGGEVLSDGPSAAVSFIERNPNQGRGGVVQPDRKWTFYATGSSARLSSGTDVMQVTAAGGATFAGSIAAPTALIGRSFRVDSNRSVSIGPDVTGGNNLWRFTFDQGDLCYYSGPNARGEWVPFRVVAELKQAKAELAELREIVARHFPADFVSQGKP